MKNTVSEDNAHARSIQDVSSSHQYAKQSYQFLFFANGGAALSMLSFLATISTASSPNAKINIDAVYTGFALAAFAFLGGVVFCILSLVCAARSSMHHSWSWEYIAKIDFGEKSRLQFALGSKMRKLAQVLFMLSLLLFTIGAALSLKAFI